LTIFYMVLSLHCSRGRTTAPMELDPVNKTVRPLLVET